jgi:hypothetical protein
MTRARLALLLVMVSAALVGGLLVASTVSSSSRPGPNVRATKYDVRLEVLPDGSLDVVESIALSVGAKPITWFDRTVPRRRTDGLTNVVALMDGAAVPVSIDARNDLKIRWEFSPSANATHVFQIRYRAVHVLAREIDGPRLLWTALPRRHSYPIDSSEITVFAPTGSIAAAVSAPGGAVLPPTPDRPGVAVGGKSLGSDRTITVDITFAPNSITPAEPQWFVEEDRQLNMLPAWLAGAACLLVVGVGILIMSFARLPRPRAPDADGAFVSPASEGSVPPGLVTLIMSRGPNAWLAIQSAFFRLVRDGQLIVEKRAGASRWRGGAFDVRIGEPPEFEVAEPAPHETWILDAVRRNFEPGGTKADLRRLMMRMSRRQIEFRARLAREGIARGWIDVERHRARAWLLITGLVLIFSGLFGGIATLMLEPSLGPAPSALPAVVVVVGLVYVVVSMGMSVLSESGLREAAAWRARVGELKAIIKKGVDVESPKDFERWFPLAIGAGIGGRWLRAFWPQLIAGNSEIAWLQALGSPADAAASLAIIIAVSGASHAGGAGGSAGAGGGAGGGSSGAG